MLVYRQIRPDLYFDLQGIEKIGAAISRFRTLLSTYSWGVLDICQRIRY
jgi:hypothetical protein